MERANETRFDYGAIPKVVFTYPMLASVGLREDEAARHGLGFRVNSQDTSSWYTSRRIGLKDSGFKVLTDQETGRILGAHLLGHNADEVINVLALAIRFAPSAGRLKRMPWAYPSGASDIDYMV